MINFSFLQQTFLTNMMITPMEKIMIVLFNTKCTNNHLFDQYQMKIFQFEQEMSL